MVNYSGVCRLCASRIVAGERIGDPQMILMAQHLRLTHPSALHGEPAPAAGDILAHFATEAGGGVPAAAPSPRSA